MTTYKGIKGVKTVSLASDPTASESIGSVWYNTAGGTLKYAIQGAAAWAATPSLNTGRAQAGACGTSSAGLFFGGEPPATAKTESYNGSAWTEVADLSTRSKYGVGGVGTQTASLCIGYHNGGSDTEIWNGSSWTETANLTTGRGRACASVAGTTTAGLYAGGQVYPTIYAITESWNGSSWTEVADLNVGRNFLAGLGTSTAMLAVGGITTPTEPTSLSALTESWNGTAWTEVNDINTARGKLAAAGITTSAMIFGGLPTGTAITEKYDGTSWTEVGDLGTPMAENTGFGTTSSAISAGNNSALVTTASQEWADPVYSIKTVTVS